MENLNFHKQKLYALILAGVALISLFLPWLSISYGLYGGGSANGLRSWGLLALLGVGAVAAAAFMEDKTKPFAGNARMIALGGFGAMVLGGVIWFIRVSSMGGGGLGSAGVKTGFGVYLCIIAGILGLLWVYGLIKLPDTTTKPPAPPNPPTV